MPSPMGKVPEGRMRSRPQAMNVYFLISGSVAAATD